MPENGEPSAALALEGLRARAPARPIIAIVLATLALDGLACARHGEVGIPPLSGCRRPRLVADGDFPQRVVAEAIADILNCGDDGRLSALSGGSEDLALFWGSYAARGEINLRAFLGSTPGTFALCDAKEGMFCCEASRVDGRWLLGGCVFNDGH